MRNLSLVWYITSYNLKDDIVHGGAPQDWYCRTGKVAPYIPRGKVQDTGIRYRTLSDKAE